MATITLRPNAAGFIASFPHQNPPETTGKDTLWVDGYVGVSGWTQVGTAPWLDAPDETSYIHTNTNGAVSYEFTFADPTYPALADIVLVTLNVKAQGDGGDSIKIEVWDGASWTLVDTWIPPTVYGWRNIDVTSLLDDRQKLMVAKVRFTYQKSGKANQLYVDASNLEVDWKEPIPHFKLVDDVTPDGDTTSIWTSETDGQKYSDLYNIPNIALPAGAVIDQIEVFNHVKSSLLWNTLYPDLWITIRTYNTAYDSGVIPLSSDVYHDESYVWTTNPFTGAPWTEAEINDLQIGCDGVSIFSGAFWIATHVTQVFVVVTYHIPAVQVIGDGVICIVQEA